MRDGRRRGAAPWAVAAVLLAWPAAAVAQAVDGRAESRVLREAAMLESRGRLDDAEAVLRNLLEGRPDSPGGLFALERVLRAGGRLAEILPPADRFLEAAPDAEGVRHLKLRVLAELDSLDALGREAERWIARRPADPGPYREVSRILARVVGTEEALAVLARGREAVDDPTGLFAETGDLLLAAGRGGEAVRALASAVGPDGSGAADVARRVRQRADDPAALVPDLVAALDADPTTPRRRAAAVELGLELGGGDAVLPVARRLATTLDGDARKGFLTELVRRAEDAGADRTTLWAYDELRRSADDEGEARALDSRAARVALAAGDTARAVEAHARLAAALPPGSAERRRVLAALVRLEAPGSGAGDSLERLRRFRAEFPSAPETDALVAEVARSLQERGRAEEAAAVLEDVAGPHSSLERGYLLLEEGDVEGGRGALLAAAGGLEPSEATAAIQLASLLGRLGPAAARTVASAAVAARRGEAAAGARAAAEAAGSLPEDQRAPVLAHAARLADGGGAAAEAARIRTVLVEAHPDAPEASEAMLELALWHAREGEGPDVAAALLERLILERPSAAVVPAARRALARLRSEGS